MRSIAHTTFVVFLVTFIAAIATVSWRSKEKERNFVISSVKEGRTFNWREVDGTCEDELPHCSKLYKSCGKYQIIRKKCKVTCGSCNRANSPPDCKLTKYGCCWDNVTIADGKDYKGCAECVDKYSECKYFADMCPTHHYIRVICPITCRVGCTQCLDNKFQASVCPMYKSHNFCKISPDLMEKICAKTCGFCPA